MIEISKMVNNYQFIIRRLNLEFLYSIFIKYKFNIVKNHLSFQDIIASFFGSRSVFYVSRLLQL